MNRKPSDLDKLKKVWYNKLRKSGFIDCEDEYQRLVEYHSTKYSSRDPVLFHSQAKYYQLAGQLLYSHLFKNAEEKAIWRFHSQGKTLAYIARKIGKSTFYVDSVVKELVEQMGKS